ncbi:hypothetical protein ACFQYP_16545 [Nonomuraea antimicrobica]
MDFDLTPEQRDLRQRVIRFARRNSARKPPPTTGTRRSTATAGRRAPSSASWAGPCRASTEDRDSTR